MTEKKVPPELRALETVLAELNAIGDDECTRRQQELKPIWEKANVAVQEKALAVVRRWVNGLHSTAYCDREVARILKCSIAAAWYVRAGYLAVTRGHSAPAGIFPVAGLPRLSRRQS